MKAIMLMFDSLNRLALEPYGCKWIKTPNFQRLADRCVTFDKSYVGSLPCMPARRELHTGRYNFLHRSWGPIEPFDDSMPELLSRGGVYTHLISDHYHYWEDGGATYHQRYSSWEFVRGQETDRWKAMVEVPAEPEHYGKCLLRNEINRKHLEKENHYTISEVYKLGLEFLENNHTSDNWFLQLESFDPHEPFWASEEFCKQYPDSYNGPRFNWPAYKKVDEPEDAVRHCRLQYAALVSECDHYVGKVLDFLDAHDMWKDTMIIVNTDHGFLLGEHDWWAKGVMPLYEEISHTPLFIWDPRYPVMGQRRRSLVQTIDLAPTLLDYFGQSVPESMQGVPLLETMRSDKAVRGSALFGMHGAQINVTDGRYVYMRKPNPGNRPLFNYTLMPTHLSQLFTTEELADIELAEPFSFTKGVKTLKVSDPKMPNVNGAISSDRFRTFLFDLENDPEQLTPLEDDAAEAQMIIKMIKLMKESDAPQEQYERLSLRNSK